MGACALLCPVRVCVKTCAATGEHQVLAQGVPQLSVTAREQVCSKRNATTGACPVGAPSAFMAL